MRAILWLACCASCMAQSVSVYSEFAKINATGEVTAPETPREILSPMLVRNGFTSFQVVIQAAAGKSWELFVGLNPQNAVRVTLYRESGEALEPATLPLTGQGTQVLWMDVWTAGSAMVQRIKIEPELNIDDDWVIYPVEGRVMDAVVPEKAAAPVAAQGAACGLQWGAPRTYVPAQSVAGMHSRNADQDSGLAQQHQTEELKKIAASCAEPASDPERYLKFRDYLFRLR